MPKAQRRVRGDAEDAEAATHSSSDAASFARDFWSNGIKPFESTPLLLAIVACAFARVTEQDIRQVANPRLVRRLRFTG